MPDILEDFSDNQPSAIHYLHTPISELKKVSEKTRLNISRLCGLNYLDMMCHVPKQAINREISQTLDLDAQKDEIVTIQVTVLKHIPSKTIKSPYRVIVSHETDQGFIELCLVYFHAKTDYIRSLLPLNAQRIISGKLDVYDDRVQIVHPDYVVALDKKHQLPSVQPLYNLTAGLTQKMMGYAVQTIINDLPDTPEWIRSDIIKQYSWTNFKESLTTIHTPKTIADCDASNPYRMRLAYDVLLAHQLSLSITRLNRKQESSFAISNNHDLQEKIKSFIAFTLTNDQKSALDDIRKDLHSGNRMNRLLQGDVGSGKTIVALLAASMVIHDRYQAAIMTPTEILAKQHYASLKPICDAVGIRIGLLTGKDKASDAKTTLANLENHQLDLIIGTHALIQERVTFAKLGLSIIDEQHRFGVSQRMALMHKGNPPSHILLMTATPIPRSLALAHYGDCDLSIIAEKPPFRKAVVTKVMPTTKLQEVALSLKRVFQEDGRVYWVCPLVEESEKIDLIAVQERYETLQRIYGDAVGIVHGKMKPAEKDEVIEQFVTGKISILVSTTVIEVGINVPEATVMIIEQAERFGLSQLHQLRGRVGRGDKNASCLLLYKAPLNPVAVERLGILKATDDGFLLAEKDLELRGSGDLIGTKQTGMLSLPTFEYEYHKNLIRMARDDAESILNADPRLTSNRGMNLRYLLTIFGYNNFLMMI